MNNYSDENPPKTGKAAKIYRAMKKAGYTVRDLHYNPNCRSAPCDMGWGTWACEIERNNTRLECFCGVTALGNAYLQKATAPYDFYSLEASPAPVAETHPPQMAD